MLEREKKWPGGIYVISIQGVGNYYGESVDILRRWATHRRQLVRQTHVNSRLKMAWKSLGAGAFHFRILEQSELLTKDTVYRRMREKFYIQNDPLCLNVRDGHDNDATELALPDRPIYRNRVVKLVRFGRNSMVKVLDAETEQLLGVETLNGKFRMGKFRCNGKCLLDRVRTREPKRANAQRRKGVR